MSFDYLRSSHLTTIFFYREWLDQTVQAVLEVHPKSSKLLRLPHRYGARGFRKEAGGTGDSSACHVQIWFGSLARHVSASNKRSPGRMSIGWM